MPTDPTPENASEKDGPEMELCLGCLHPNEPQTTFCAKCGAPLTSYAATGPFESLLAEGHVYRRAAEEPTRLVVVLGVWLIFGMAALASVTLILFASRQDVAPLIVGAFLLSVSLAMLWRTTRSYFARPRSVEEPTDPDP